MKTKPKPKPPTKKEIMEACAPFLALMKAMGIKGKIVFPKKKK